MSAYGLLSGCAHRLLSMWVNAYFFSAIYNEHWVLISFSEICVPTCHCFCGYTLTLSLSVPSPTTLGHNNIPCVLFPRPRPLGGDSPSQSWARGDKTYDHRVAALDYVCLLLCHYLPHAPPKTRPATHTTPLLAPHFLPIFLPPSNTPFLMKVYWP